jgi:hypothetical protein
VLVAVGNATKAAAEIAFTDFAAEIVFTDWAERTVSGVRCQTPPGIFTCSFAPYRPRRQVGQTTHVAKNVDKDRTRLPLALQPAPS